VAQKEGRPHLAIYAKHIKHTIAIALIALPEVNWKKYQLGRRSSQTGF
jgi:hypothetical protein